MLTHEVSCVTLLDHKTSLPEQNANSTMTVGERGWMFGGPLDRSRKVTDI
jgi:hypothetical protein